MNPQLKEQDGRYYQQCKVVMLPTDKFTLTTLCKCTRENGMLMDALHLGHLSKPLNKNELKDANRGKDVIGVDRYFDPYHLYILSDDEIKEGDWCLFYNSPSEVLEINGKHAKIKSHSFATESDINMLKNINPNTTTKIGDKTTMIHSFSIAQLRKIIATTDESLTIKQGTLEYPLGEFNLPKPSNSFISKYIEEYNKGSQINDVLVEYDWNGFHTVSKEVKLKVDSDNTITIKKVKDSYSREEVSIYIEKYRKDFESFKKECHFGPNEKEIKYWTEQWIKENL